MTHNNTRRQFLSQTAGLAMASAIPTLASASPKMASESGYTMGIPGMPALTKPGLYVIYRRPKSGGTSLLQHIWRSNSNYCSTSYNVRAITQYLINGRSFISVECGDGHFSYSNNDRDSVYLFDEGWHDWDLWTELKNEKYSNKLILLDEPRFTEHDDPAFIRKIGTPYYRMNNAAEANNLTIVLTKTTQYPWRETSAAFYGMHSVHMLKDGKLTTMHDKVNPHLFGTEYDIRSIISRGRS